MNLTGHYKFKGIYLILIKILIFILFQVLQINYSEFNSDFKLMLKY